MEELQEDSVDECCPADEHGVVHHRDPRREIIYGGVRYSCGACKVVMIN
jgi:hypothetical protein